MIYHEIRTIVFLDDFRLFIFYLLCKIYNTNSITDIRLSGALFITPPPPLVSSRSLNPNKKPDPTKKERYNKLTRYKNLKKENFSSGIIGLVTFSRTYDANEPPFVQTKALRWRKGSML